VPQQWVGGGESGGGWIEFVLVALLDFQVMKSKFIEKPQLSVKTSG